MKTNQLTSAALFTAILPFATLYDASSVSAQETTLVNDLERINIAGRQRMLSQRITMAACFLQNGVNIEAQKAIIEQAFALFSTTLEALKSGNAEMGLGPESDPKVMTALRQVDRRWSRFFPQVLSIVEQGRASVDDVAKLDESGLALLNDMHQAVITISGRYGEVNEDVSLIESTMADVPGRQRMLSQKAAKQFCLIDSGVDVAENRVRLAETTALFTNTLNALIGGIPGLVLPPPNEQVRDKLLEVRAAWSEPQAVLENAANGGEISEQDQQIIALQMEDVLFLMNEAVQLYDKAGQNIDS